MAATQESQFRLHKHYRFEKLEKHSNDNKKKMHQSDHLIYHLVRMCERELIYSKKATDHSCPRLAGTYGHLLTRDTKDSASGDEYPQQ